MIRICEVNGSLLWQSQHNEFVIATQKQMFNFKFKKMKNLENYGVQEMNAKEITETEGGILVLIAVAFAWGVAYGYTKEKFESGEWSL